MNNKDKTYFVDGYVMTISEMSRKFGKPYSTIYNRIEVLKWSPHMAVHTPVEFRSTWDTTNFFNVKGFYGTLPTIADHFKIDYNSLRRLVNKTQRDDKDVEYAVVQLINKKNKRIQNINNNNKIKNRVVIDRKDPIYIECKRYHKDYFRVSHRVKSEGFTLEEAMNVPANIVNTKNVTYNGRIGTLQALCRKHNKDFVKVYNMLLEMYDLNYAMALKETDL